MAEANAERRSIPHNPICPAPGARNPMFVQSLFAAARTHSAPARRMARRGVRWVIIGISLIFIAVGSVFLLLPLPTHLPGLLLLVLGLIMVLRTSYSARRTFIKVQRRHPKMVFPLRRLLRREPEVMPVAWQQLLRTERRLIPKRWRFAKRTRLRFVKRRRR
jgi:hypothetical protein